MMTHRNRYRPKRRSAASTRFARMDLSNQETGGFEPLMFKPPPNGRWCTIRAQWPPGRGVGISPPEDVGRVADSTANACLKVTFSRDHAEEKVTFIRGIDPPWRRPRESIQNRSGPVGSTLPEDVGRVADSTTRAFMKFGPWWATKLVALQEVNRPRESIACLKVTFSRGHAEKKVTFIKAQRRRPRESIQNRSGPVGSNPPSRFSRPRESIAGRKVTFGMGDAEKKVTFIKGIDPPWRRARESIRIRSGSHDVDIGCKGRRRTPWGLARASDGSTPSDRDVGQFGESAFAHSFRADGGHPGHRRRPREPVRENDRLQRPPGVGRSGEHDPRDRMWVRCVGESGSRGRGVSMRERVLKTRRAGVLSPC